MFKFDVNKCDHMPTFFCGCRIGMRFPFKILLVLVLGLGIFLCQEADACTRVLWRTADAPDNPLLKEKKPESVSVIVGRTEDWSTTVNNKFRVFPRGIRRDGLAQTNSLTWTSKYGSLVLTLLDIATHEGMNEAGLSARLLALGEADYGSREEARPGLLVTLVPQYFLDNFATVAEAVQALTEKKIQIIPIKSLDQHWSLEDASGDSAVIEFVNGQMQVYHDRAYTVMTNDPTYDKQIAHLQKYKANDFKDLPGGLLPPDRFVRAYYYGSRLCKPQDQNQAVAYMFGLLGNISVPFYQTHFGEFLFFYPTWWRSVMDLTNQVYFFSSMLKPNVVWVNMSKLDFSPHAPQREFDVEWGPDVSGDISHLLEKVKDFEFKVPERNSE